MITFKQEVDFDITVKAFKIFRNFESTQTIILVNDGATVSFPKTLIVTDSYQCADFKIYIKETELIAGENVVTLIFDGIYKRPDCYTFNISLNGSAQILKINCVESGGGDGGGTNPEVQPLIQPVNLYLNNRQNYIFNTSGVPFLKTENYYSPVASHISEIKITGAIPTLTLNGLPYANEWIAVADLINLVHTAPDTDNFSSYTMNWQAKDADGRVSDTQSFVLQNNLYSTIVWGTGKVTLKPPLTEKSISITYSGATGQVAVKDTVVFAFMGASEIIITVDENKTLTNDGTLNFKVSSDLVASEEEEATFNYFGQVIIDVYVIVFEP